MTNDTSAAKKDLETKGYTCVLRKGETSFFSFEHGVKPLLQWIREGKNFEGFGAADQVVGKAAALLYIRLGVRDLYGQVMSEQGAAVLESHDVAFVCDEMVPYIINRRKDGMCPMEQAVLEISDPEEAVKALEDRIRSLQKK